MIKANPLKSGGAKLQGLKSNDYASQLPVNLFSIDRLIGVD
jgi:hypothetical protein